MKIVLGFMLGLFLHVSAPFQCASEPDPNRRLERRAPEALWALAERFRAEGNEAARRTTLEELAREYPNSREAERASLELRVE